MSIDADTVPIVLVHGWAGSAESWGPVSELLGNTSTIGPVVSVRLPGSPGAPKGEMCTISGAATSVIAALRELRRPAVIVGHSMGAQVTLMTQLAVPDVVLGEVVIDPAYASTDTVAEMSEWAAEIDRRGHDALAGFFETAMGGGLPESSTTQIRADLLHTSSATIASYLRSEYVDPDAIGLMSHTRDAAAQRTRPVLAIHSSDLGAEAESQLAAPPGSTIETWPGVGHYLHLENPQRFVSAVVEWCSTLTRASEELAPS